MVKKKSNYVHFIVYPSEVKNYYYLQAEEFDISEAHPEGVIVWDFFSAINRAACETMLKGKNSFEIDYTKLIELQQEMLNESQNEQLEEATEEI